MKHIAGKSYAKPCFLQNNSVLPCYVSTLGIKFKPLLAGNYPLVGHYCHWFVSLMWWAINDDEESLGNSMAKYQFKVTILWRDCIDPRLQSPLKTTVILNRTSDIWVEGVPHNVLEYKRRVWEQSKTLKMCPPETVIAFQFRISEAKKLLHM